jgi:hypothetical protein
MKLGGECYDLRNVYVFTFARKAILIGECVFILLNDPEASDRTSRWSCPNSLIRHPHQSD